ncbi:DUF2075 domain-containing protein [Bifidobacterium sp. 82T10]|uniref:DUF2075 domain-containing protein n=1 Tax=Bifidobacterium miconis TaxID=2834435 RepID=A0ABS6WCT3_9BIFI|nr:DNA/RNA helicase domain-containing protein [Bifidobacterium miconis]MBW3091869.1 DUF2075 domain-containing protein [Bifidobacterium miconis]
MAKGEQLRFRIVNVPYAHTTDDNGQSLESSDEYRQEFLDRLRDPMSWVTPSTTLERVSLEFMQERAKKEENHFLEWPTLYIVWFENPEYKERKNKKDKNKKGEKEKWCVYVGETNHIIDRTLQHVLIGKNSKKKSSDSEVEDFIDAEVAEKSQLDNYIESENKANQCITKAVGAGSSVCQYVVWESHFNKSLTLDIENKLIDYMKSIDDVRCLNGRGNPQNSYYTSAYLDAIVAGIWKRLVAKDKNGIFPPEEQIWQTSLYKISPFHKLGDGQRKALGSIVSEVNIRLNQWESPKDTTLILVEGAAGTGKSILLSTLFYELARNLNEYGDDGDDSVDDSKLHSRVSLLVNNKDQKKVYDDMATKHNIQKKNGQCVFRPTQFINSRAKSVAKGSWDYLDIDGIELADVVLIDEAHLLFTQKVQNGIDNQLHEILRRAKVVIAVFDPEQIMQRKQWWNDTLLTQLSLNEKSSNKGSEKKSGEKSGGNSMFRVLDALTLTSSYSNKNVNGGEKQFRTDTYGQTDAEGNKHGCVEKIKLTEQFRIDAGADVVRWLDDIADNKPFTLTKPGTVDTPVPIPHDDKVQYGSSPASDAADASDAEANAEQSGDDVETITKGERIPYEIKVCQSPDALFRAIRGKGDDMIDRQRREIGKGKSAIQPRDLCRVVATFDWRFDVAASQGNVVLVKDDPQSGSQDLSAGGHWYIPEWDAKKGEYVVEGHDQVFKRPWNRSKDKDSDQTKDGDAGRTIRADGDAWSSSDQTKDEVGSYFTIQGFDLNYAGVIIGPSVSYDFEHGKLVFKPELSCDPGVTSDRSDIKDSAAQLAFKKQCVRKQLNVLLKRGVHGVYLFAVDPDLQHALWNAAAPDQRITDAASSAQ